VGPWLPSFERGGWHRPLVVFETVGDPALYLGLPVLGELPASVGSIEQGVDHEALVELARVDQPLELEARVQDCPMPLPRCRARHVAALAVESRESALGGSIPSVDRLAWWRQRVWLREDGIYIERLSVEVLAKRG
jgi:hypothetical protein